MDYTIEYDTAVKNLESIDIRLKALYSTMAGTQPLDREFGLELSEVIGMPPEVARNTLAVEIVDKTARYVPEVEASEVTFEASDDGTLRPTIRITNSEDYEDSEEEDEDNE